MEVLSFKSQVENGCIRLPEGVKLPENTQVYVVAPGIKSPQTPCIRSPRLADSPKAAIFTKLVVTEEKDA
jgi:hypothetical protein